MLHMCLCNQMLSKRPSFCELAPWRVGLAVLGSLGTTMVNPGTTLVSLGTLIKFGALISLGTLSNLGTRISLGPLIKIGLTMPISLGTLISPGRNLSRQFMNRGKMNFGLINLISPGRNLSHRPTCVNLQRLLLRRQGCHLSINGFVSRLLLLHQPKQ